MSPSWTSSASPRSGRVSSAVSVTGVSVTRISKTPYARLAPLLLLPGLSGRALSLRPTVAAAGRAGARTRLGPWSRRRRLVGNAVHRLDGGLRRRTVDRHDAVLRRAALRRAVLRRAVLRRAALRRAALRRAALRRAALRRAALRRAVLRRAVRDRVV